MQLTLMISIIHRDFFIHQTYTFVIILMYALALFWRNLPPFMSTNDGIEAQNDLTGMDQAKGNAKNGGCTNLICCIWGDFFMEHAGYIALIVWDLLFLMEEGVSVSKCSFAIVFISPRGYSNEFLCEITYLYVINSGQH